MILADILTENNLTIAVAESCTGGSLSAKLTEKSGASKYFDRGFISYSNQAKIDMLGVQKSTLDKFGAVSEQIAIEMVRGVVKNSTADIAIAITGIAGPQGDSTEKPVGTVCFAFHICGKTQTTTQHFVGNRASVVQSSVNFAIDFLKKSTVLLA